MSHDGSSQRTLKIAETTRGYELRHQGAKSTPSIRLIGQWLHQAGFVPGDHVTIEVAHQQLVIRPRSESK